MLGTTPDGWTQSGGRIDSGAVGQRLGNLFKIEASPALITRSLQAAQIAVTELRADHPVLGLTDPVPVEDAYLLSLMFRSLDRHEVWEDSKACPRRSIAAGQFHLRDLKRGQAALIEQPHHSLNFYLPRAALDEIADGEDARRVDGLRYRPGVAINDPVVWSLGSCLRRVLERPQEASRLLFDHLALALGVHLARRYGGLEPGSKVRRGGLAAWQERRAKDMLSADPGDAPSLRQVAADCGLSASHFSRAFKQTTGIAPHQWLMRRRVEAAKAALTDARLSLAEVALSCGFADQSHLTRVFSRVAGIGPGAWRRDRER